MGRFVDVMNAAQGASVPRPASTVHPCRMADAGMRRRFERRFFRDYFCFNQHWPRV